MKWQLSGLALALSLGLPCDAFADPPPYKIVRSLQIVQDRLAGGDQAALPMQRKLLTTVDARLRAASAEDFNDPRNVRSLLVYAASGGNPETLEKVLSRINIDATHAAAAEVICHYLRGDLAEARDALRDIRPLTLDDELAAPLALIAGSLLAQENPEEALRLFDHARLIKPGTLVEEAALRRTITVSARLGDSDRFSRAALQYVRRFLRSPYATHFAQDFVTAVMTMHDEIELPFIEEAAGLMSEEQARVTYLRIARESAIAGYQELLVFASDKAGEYAWDSSSENDDPRARLYQLIAAIPSAEIDQLLERLNQIEPQHLSVQDHTLLQAARTVAAAIIAPPGPLHGEGSLSSEAQEGADSRDIQLATANADLVANALTRLEAIDALLERGGR